MITVKQAMENPELMIKYKEYLKNVEIFKEPWYDVFWKHPYLYREFSDRFDEMGGEDIYCALVDDPTLISDLKDYLHKMGGLGVACVLRDAPTLILDLKNQLHKIERWSATWLLRRCPKLSLCLKYLNDPDKVEAAYYIGYPHKLDDLNKEEKREMSERIMELLREEKV